MSVSFNQTVRSLDAVSPRYPAFAKFFILLVFTGWCTWFFTASFPLYETSKSAELHVTAPLFDVESPWQGRIVDVPVGLGAKVSAGDALLVLDATPLTLESKQLRAELTALERKAEAVDKAWELQREALARVDDQFQAQRRASTAVKRENQSRQAGLTQQRDRQKALLAQGLVAESDYADLSHEATGAAYAVEAEQHVTQRLEAEGKTLVLDRRIELAELERERAEIEARVSTVGGRLETLEHRIAAHTLRSPVSGVVAEIPNWTRGAVASAGERVVTILPEDELRMVAWFGPEQALGRIRSGLAARMKLDGFPWTRYGRLNGVVTEVAGVPENGLIKVVLHLPPGQMEGVALRHGLPGILDVEIDRVSPAVFLLQLLGKDVTSEEAGFE